MHNYKTVNGVRDVNGEVCEYSIVPYFSCTLLHGHLLIKIIDKALYPSVTYLIHDCLLRSKPSRIWWVCISFQRLT
jgi:hypothetical protein